MANVGDPIDVTIAQYPTLAAAQASRAGDPNLSNFRQEGSYFLADEKGVGSVFIGRLPYPEGDPAGSGSGIEPLLRALGMDGQLNKASPDATATGSGVLNMLAAPFDNILPNLKLPKWFWWVLVAGVALVIVGSASKGQGGNVGRYAVRRYARR